MAQTLGQVRVLSRKKMSELFDGVLTYRKHVDRENQKTGELYSVVTVLQEKADEMFEVRIVGEFPKNIEKGSKVDFEDFEYTVRANGRRFGESVGGELQETMTAMKVVKAQ